LDFVIVTALIFFLWMAAKKTKKLLKRLEPEEKLAHRQMIVVKADLNGVQNTHLITPEAPAVEPEPATAVPAGVAFEMEQPEAAAKPAKELAPAASEPWKEFTWEPGEPIEIGAR